MFLGDSEQGSKFILAINGAGRIVRIDDYYGLSLFCDLGTDIFLIGLPAVGFIAEIMNRLGPAKRRRCCP